MTGKKVFLFTSLAIFCFSCTNEVDNLEKAVSFDSTQTMAYPTIRTEDDAINEAKLFTERLDTRTSNEAYVVGDVYLQKDFTTKRNLPLFYIVNREGYAGYSIISANTNLPAVLAYSESGNISFNDTIQHPELSFFFDLLQAYITDPGNEKYETEDHSPLDISQTRARRRPLYETKPEAWNETERVDPLIPIKWGQRAPYNHAAPLINGQRALTGCVATAIAQVMAYHEKPSGHDGTSYNWSEMKSNPYLRQLLSCFVL